MKPIYSAAALAFSLLLLSAGAVQAQTQAGMRLGLNASQVIGDQTTDPSSMGYGYQVGLFMRTYVGSLRLQPELLISSRRYEFTQVLGDAGATKLSEKKISATYFDFPIYVVVDISDHVNLLVGPMISISMAGKQTVKDAPNGDNHAFELFDAGAAGGISYITNSGIDFSLRGQIGFLPLYKKTDENKTGPEKPDINNLSFQFTIGLPISNSSEAEPKPKGFKESY